ncbi:MAG: hypothetical protein RBG13Loki_1203 [Promethearchaeota archaeon CR_4]|nr:MAG: hypothetical protein RBG13Loki_1203 [Candidatus Lokiarchaeota archaeon CR_4]
MDFFSHILFGIFAATLAVRPFNLAWVIFGGLMAGLPDFDALLAPLNKIRKSFYFQHRGGSHSFLTAIVVAIPLAGIFTYISGENFFVAWISGALFYGLHLSLDALTTYRTPLFYPIRKTTYKLDFERAVNPVLMGVSLGIILFLSLSQWTDNTLQTTITGIAIAYFGYLGYRIGVKLVVQRTALPGTRVLPGTLPLVYYRYRHVITDSTTAYSFTKYVSVCHKTEQLYNSEFRAGSPEYAWFQKARELIPKGHFFGAWDCIIPIIKVQGNQVLVKVIFAEGYMSYAAFCITIEFEQDTKRVVDVRHGFERLERSRQNK